MNEKQLKIEINEAIKDLNIPMLCVIQEHGHVNLIDEEIKNLGKEYKKKLSDKMQELVKKVASSKDEAKYFQRQSADCFKSIEDILLPDPKDKALYKINKIAKKVGLE